MPYLHHVNYRLTPRAVTNLAFELTKVQALSTPVILWAVFVFVLTAAVGLREEAIEGSFVLFSVALPGLMLALALPALLFFLNYRRFTTVGDRLGAITYELYDDGLIARSDRTETHIQYKVFDGYTRTSSGYLLRLAGAGLFFIPAADKELQKFIESKITRIRREHTFSVHPWIAALLNALAFGAGYLYIGKRQIMAAFLLAANLFFVLALVYYETTSFGNWRQDIAYALIAAALGVDAYIEARKTTKP
ncbi:MAG: hypothetical protein K0S68_819 [Candidatus Saccharibacteria bacterium]|jgi:peptidoglycan/LPS O-acetylase OafA/YrhL|nr:hypothetical protein [Candidatus Saccharibacteria bacterium]